MNQPTLELLQWLKLKGIQPSTFEKEDTFFVLEGGTKTLLELTDEDMKKGVVWAPSFLRLTDFLRQVKLVKSFKSQQLEPGLYLITGLADHLHFEGSGRCPTDALIRALQNRTPARPTVAHHAGG